MIHDESIRHVLDRADIVEVVSQFISLKRRGTNYIANCPFHNEKTPSFNVNPGRGIFKCFGCGKGGDVVSFIQEYEKFSFLEAVRWLADFYNVELEETEAPPAVQQQQQVVESLRIVNEFAASYFERILHEDEEGQIIGGGYFKERGFEESLIRTFRLGYSLDQWEAFATEALRQGFDKDILEKAGLIKIRDSRVYDSYRGRVMFPVFSNSGRIVGFGARILKKNDKAPKYVNSPENELYVKHKILYGLYQARQAIRDADECLLVEGYTDVLSLYQGGVRNVVASSGTSLTEGQLKLIGNLSRNLTIIYDGDPAGIKAALRGLDLALGQRLRVRLVLLPDAQDPDSFIREAGAEAFKAYLAENKQDIIDFRLEVGLKEAGKDPVKKARLINDIAETLSKIDRTEDFSIQQHYVKKCASELQIEEEGLVNLINKFFRERVQQELRRQQREDDQEPPAESPAGDTPDTGFPEASALLKSASDHKEEWQLLRVLLEYGHKPYEDTLVAHYFFETVDPDLFEDPLAKEMVCLYQQRYLASREIPEMRVFVNHANPAIRQKAADLLQQAHAPSEKWLEDYKIAVPFGEAIYLDEVRSSFAYFELKLLRDLLKENWSQLQQETEPEEQMVLMRTHMELKERERQLMDIVIIK